MTGIAPTQTAASTTLSDLQQTVTGKITSRLTKLAALDQSLQANTSLSATDRQQLEGEISSDETGLQALQTKVAGETSGSAVRADAKSMVVDYRVYTVAAPQVHLAEHTANQETRIANLQTKLNDQIQAGGSNPGSSLTDAQTELNAAQTALQGQGDSLVALTPADYTSTLFNQYHAAIGSASAYINSARTDLAL